jgi:fructokinase
MHLVGIDLGGTKIEGAVIDSDHPTKPLCRLRVPTEAEGGYEHVLDQIVKLDWMLREQAAVELPPSLGIGTPGTLDPSTRLLRGSNTQCLNGRPLRDDLEQRLELAVSIANDANCFALAEATLGVAAGYETVFGIIMGTGCGSGLVVNGRVLNGCHGIAGEWGQIVIDPDGPASKYGTKGTIEAFLAGPALEAWYADQTGTPRKLHEIVSRMRADEAAAATIERLLDYFARSVSIVIDVFDPHAIVIGGGVGNIDALYSGATRDLISSRVFSPPWRAALLRPALGDSAGVFGAAMLAV